MINTALILEPRDLKRLPLIINHFHFILGESWKIVFYCGNSMRDKWLSKVNKEVEIRELPTNNLLPREYSDLLKSESLWNSLYGDFVLVFQADTWIMNEPPYTIDYFLQMNKAYIGGNMAYRWFEIDFRTPFPTYNGGLSLRKRSDMLTIIQAYPPLTTHNNPYSPDKSTHPPFTAMAEDVYFVKGAYLLNLPLGDDSEECFHFAIHTIFYPQAFGVHCPNAHVKHQLIQLYPEVQTAYI